MVKVEPQRGEIWWVRLNPTVGDEIQKTRPSLVISRDDLASLRLRLVVPITGWKPFFSSIPWLVRLDPSPQNGLVKPSTANPLQTRSVALERFVDKLGSLDEETLELIVLGLGVVIHYPG
jgi:mRNA interferase MazF